MLVNLDASFLDQFQISNLTQDIIVFPFLGSGIILEYGNFCKQSFFHLKALKIISRRSFLLYGFTNIMKLVDILVSLSCFLFENRCNRSLKRSVFFHHSFPVFALGECVAWANFLTLNLSVTCTLDGYLS